MSVGEHLPGLVTKETHWNRSYEASYKSVYFPDANMVSSAEQSEESHVSITEYGISMSDTF